MHTIARAAVLGALLGALAVARVSACQTPHSGTAAAAVQTSSVSGSLPDWCTCAPAAIQQMSIAKSALPPVAPRGAPGAEGEPVFHILMENYSFVPFEAIVAEGTTIRWTNLDMDLHDTVSFTGGWQSTYLSLGQSFDYATQFDNRGTFEYVCTLHGGMYGLLTIVEVPEPTGVTGLMACLAGVLGRRPRGVGGKTNPTRPSACDWKYG
jgi:plastocyanin